MVYLTTSEIIIKNGYNIAKPHKWWNNVCDMLQDYNTKTRTWLINAKLFLQEYNCNDVIRNNIGPGYGYILEFKTGEDAVAFLLKWS